MYVSECVCVFVVCLFETARKVGIGSNVRVGDERWACRVEERNCVREHAKLMRIDINFRIGEEDIEAGFIGSRCICGSGADACADRMRLILMLVQMYDFSRFCFLGSIPSHSQDPTRTRRCIGVGDDFSYPSLSK